MHAAYVTIEHMAEQIKMLRKAAAAWKQAAKGYREALKVCDAARAEDVEYYRDLVSFCQSMLGGVSDYVDCPDCAHRQEAVVPDYYNVGNVTCEKCGCVYTVELVQYLVEKESEKN